MEEKAGKWTAAHRRAMSGWFIAAYDLYTRSKPISPYGFDRDLLDRLNEIIDLVDVKRQYLSESFAPIRVADARLAIKDVSEEAVRLAGLVPIAIKSGNLESARSFNESASEGLDKVKTAGVDSVNGVTPKLVKDNAKYIESLSAGKT